MITRQPRPVDLHRLLRTATYLWARRCRLRSFADSPTERAWNALSDRAGAIVRREGWVMTAAEETP